MFPDLSEAWGSRPKLWPCNELKHSFNKASTSRAQGVGCHKLTSSKSFLFLLPLDKNRTLSSVVIDRCLISHFFGEAGEELENIWRMTFQYMFCLVQSLHISWPQIQNSFPRLTNMSANFNNLLPRFKSIVHNIL